MLGKWITKERDYRTINGSVKIHEDHSGSRKIKLRENHIYKKSHTGIEKKGKVGVIKHLGDHEFGLEDGKDTTFFFEAGADITSGIDAHKTVMAIHNNTLDETLRAYLTYGIDFTVIEGYKEQEYAKIVIGSLEVDRCILKNPTHSGSNPID